MIFVVIQVVPASSLIPNYFPHHLFFFFFPFFSRMSLSSFCLLIKIPAEGRECCLAPLCTNPTSSHSVGSNLRCCAGGTEITTLQRSRSFWVAVSLLWGSSNLFFLWKGFACLLLFIRKFSKWNSRDRMWNTAHTQAEVLPG